MPSHNISPLTRGFTLLEIVVVIAIFSVLVSLALFMSMDSYRGFMFRSERSVLVNLLEKSRSRSMANLYQLPHGVCFDTVASRYVLFRGTSFASGVMEDEVDVSQGLSIHGLPLCSVGAVLFTQLSGTTTPVTITVTQNARTENISINYEGTINW